MEELGLFDDFNSLLDGWNQFLDGPGSGIEGSLGGGGHFPGSLGAGNGFLGGVGDGTNYPGSLGAGNGFLGGLGDNSDYLGGLGGGWSGGWDDGFGNYQGGVNDPLNLLGAIGDGTSFPGGVNDGSFDFAGNLYNGGIGDESFFPGGIGDGSFFPGGIGDGGFDPGIPAVPDNNEFGAKVWKYNPHTGDVVDLLDGIGDPGQGWGDPSNRYAWSMEAFNGDLYVGVLNGNPIEGNLLPRLFHDADQYPTLHSTGPEIWRWSPDVNAVDGGTWDKVLDNDDVDVDFEDQVGIRKLLGFGDYLYGTTSNNLLPVLYQGSQTQATMVRSMDGDTWEEVTGGPFNNPDNNSIRALEEFDGLLYVGTETDLALLENFGFGLFDTPSPEVWTYDGTVWNKLGNGYEVDGFAVSEILNYDGSVYFGNWNVDGFNLYMIDVFGDFHNITPQSVDYVGGPVLPGYITNDPVGGPYGPEDFGDTTPFNDLGIIKMFEFDGYMYLGTVDYEEGTSLMRSMTPGDTDSWELITADGFLSEKGPVAVNAPPGLNSYIWSSAVVSNGIDELFIGTFNGDQGTGQLLSSTNGVDFDFVTQDAFGIESIYGFRNLEPMDDYLFAGGASPITRADYSADPYPLPDPSFDFPII